VKLVCGVADLVHKKCLDIHMDVLEIWIEHNLSHPQLALHDIQTLGNGVALLASENAYARQHARMSHGSQHIVIEQAPIKTD